MSVSFSDQVFHGRMHTLPGALSVFALIFIGLSAPHPERVLAETPAKLLLDSPPPSKEDPESERRTWVTGDSIRGRFVVRGNSEAKLLLRSPTLEGFKVRTIESSRYLPKEDVHQLEVEFVTLRPGERLLGPFTLEILGQGEAKVVEIRGTLISVRSALEGADSLDPRPRAEPLPVRVPNGAMIVLLYALAALALLIPLAYLLARRIAKAREARRPPPPPRPPWESALEAIEKLRSERKARLETGDHESAIEAFTDELSDIVRAYLGERYGFDGLESTSDELLEALEARAGQVGRKSDAIDSVRAFLHEADLVKFAKARLDGEALDAILYSARRIVIETRPYRSEETIR